MWDTKNSFDYLGIVSGKKKKLIHDVCEKFTIPSVGVALLFDRFDYKSYPRKSIWRNLGNHLNIEFGDKCDHKTPKIIEEFTDSMNFSHLIWLSRRAWSGKAIDLVWFLSHELRHLEQDTENRFLSLSGNFLYRNLSGVEIEEPKVWITVPTELDAELAAWRTSLKIFNSREVKSYINKPRESVDKQEHFRILSEYNPKDSYDVQASLILLLRKYQIQLDEIIKDVYGSSSVLISIDNMCKELTKNT